MIDENVLSYFPARVYDGIEDLPETITNSANCISSRVNLFAKETLLRANP